MKIAAPPMPSALSSEPAIAMLGADELDRARSVELIGDRSHLLARGRPGSGRTHLLRSVALQLMQRPQVSTLVLTTPYEAVSLAGAPGWSAMAGEPGVEVVASREHATLVAALLAKVGTGVAGTRQVVVLDKVTVDEELAGQLAGALASAQRAGVTVHLLWASCDDSMDAPPPPALVAASHLVELGPRAPAGRLLGSPENEGALLRLFDSGALLARCRARCVVANRRRALDTLVAVGLSRPMAGRVLDRQPADLPLTHESAAGVEDVLSCLVLQTVSVRAVAALLRAGGPGAQVRTDGMRLHLSGRGGATYDQRDWSLVTDGRGRTSLSGLPAAADDPAAVARIIARRWATAQ